VTSGAAARRYARALFDVVLKEQPASLDQVQKDLQQFADLFTTNATLSSVISNPAIPPAKKVALTKALLERAGSVAAPLAKLMVLLAEKDRLMLLADLSRAYGDRLMDHQQVIRGEVTTAVPLAADKLRALEQGLKMATGRTVMLESRVDPSIVGGVITRLGSTVYDGSVTTQLQKMKQSLIEAGQ
jgi:F-type H+-transporting ATPase subunit delta